MASNIKYAVSATPIYTMSAAEAASDVDVIAADIAKTVGGSGSSTCGYGNIIGFANDATGTPSYPDISTATNYGVGSTAVSLGTFTASKFVYIKHSGFLFDTGSTLGLSTTAKLKICMAATIADATTIAVLNAGDAIVLPYNEAVTPSLFAAGDGVAIAVEFFSVRAS